MAKLAALVPSISDPAPHLFWITSRAAGDLALVTSSLSAGLGLMMVNREFRSRGRDLRIVHESLSLVALVAIGVHGAALLGDKFMHPSLADVLVPFAWSYRGTWTALGVIAGWSLVALGPTFYIRGRIGPSRWRSLHRLSALAWLAGLAHAFGDGTDAGEAWFIAMTCTVAVPAIVLLVVRLVRRQTPKPAPVRGGGRSRRPPQHGRSAQTGALTDAT